MTDRYMNDRFRKFEEKLKAGDTVCVGFIGGSITDGSLADFPTQSFADRVVEQLRLDYPSASIDYVNRGVGGTDSIYGNARLQTDLLDHHPDLVIVDFTVNDKDEPIFRESFEGLIRRILKSDSKPAVLVLENIFYDDGHSAEAQHHPVCEHYGLPEVKIRESLYRELQEGKKTIEEITPDGLHPGNDGHARIAEEVRRKLRDAFQEAGKTEDSEAVDTALPDPLTRNRFENPAIVTAVSPEEVMTSMQADESEPPYGPAGRPPKFRDGWTGRPGERFEMDFSGSCLAVFYRKTLKRPGCSAVLNLDGAQVLLNGEFKKDWGECLYVARILDEYDHSDHHLTITVTGEENALPFYLNGLITA